MPAISLYPYQLRWIKDPSRFAIAMQARQTGKTFATCLGIVLDCLRAESQGRRERWIILSRGERQAKEAMDEALKPQLKAYEAAFESLEYEYEGSYRALEVELPGGSKITALPANPDTARGHSANCLLDEFAFHKDSGAIWKALFPVVSKPGLKLRITSTPNGKGNKFYELFTGADPIWSRHRTDIYQAVADGLPRDPEELRRALNDEEAWRQEYLLEWVDETSAWIPFDLIAACEDERLEPTDSGWRNPHPPSGPAYLGWDIARRKDLSILWVIAQVGECLEVVRMRGWKFEQQLDQFRALFDRYDLRRACLDQTGMGEAIVELAAKAVGPSRVEGVLFTGTNKQALATDLKRRYEDRQTSLPIDREIRDSIHSVKRLTTSAGNLRFDAERTDAGHADYFWAQALAHHAADRPYEIAFQSLPREERTMPLLVPTGRGWGTLRLPDAQ